MTKAKFYIEDLTGRDENLLAIDCELNRELATATRRGTEWEVAVSPLRYNGVVKGLKWQMVDSKEEAEVALSEMSDRVLASFAELAKMDRM